MQYLANQNLKNYARRRCQQELSASMVLNCLTMADGSDVMIPFPDPGHIGTFSTSIYSIIATSSYSTILCQSECLNSCSD